ncbi:MAG: fibronectin type III domain-containing protein, partial [Candidatus Marinimicrobia bacterium]|nr:fibronectin type III domain-containing protein [Candidatus Neomarinimicrobiota bacterium]
DLMDTDPGFVGNGDYSLAASSVAIGAGIDEYENTDAPAYDYNNSIRPNPDGSDPDLGAFENSLSVTPYPAKPQNLTVDSEGDSTIILSWMANTEDDLAQYKIYYGTSSATTLLDSVSGTPAYTATGLDNYTTYYFAVSAEDLDDYESAKSNEVSGEPKWSGPNWYVHADSGSSSGDGSPAAPFREIQDAIDAVDPLSRADGLADTILVLPGTYDDGDDQELYFKYTDGNNQGQPKNIVLKSRDGAATTILDGVGNRVFEIVDGTDTTLQIIGFTITASDGGKHDGNGSVIKIGYIDEGNWTTHYSGATFKNCLIKDVDGEDAAVQVISEITVFVDCELSDNTADYTESGDGLGGAVRVGNEWSEGGSTVHFYRSRLLNNTITTSQSDQWLAGGALAVGKSNQNSVKLVNTIVAG